MDFALSEEQEAVADLAGRILDEQQGSAERAWAELAKANLLGLCLPTDVGGSGYGFVEACILFEQLGRTVAPVPLLPTVVCAMAIAEHGTAEQRQRWLPGVVSGDVVLTADVDGSRSVVPYAHQAAAVLLVDDDGVRIVERSELELERQQAGSGEPMFRIPHHPTLRDFPADSPGNSRKVGEGVGDGAAATAWIRLHWTVALCAVQTGVTERALRLTAEYVAGRQQFERPIGSFQAVGQRLADAYIDVEAIRLTMWQAAWRLAHGLESGEQVAIAKFQASDGGQRVCAAAQHLHGGVGVALDYPLHRYTLWAKQVELTLGSGTPQLVKIGELL
ncbi:MAG: 3-oxocholest-4-en-26-oyl-CoA dehydrogenase beta subunit [Actinomycetota bacterium]|jgi:alkylation response protein AidB-like acyl-CoA dehydrogenase